MIESRFTIEELIQHVELCLENSDKNKSKLTSEILNMEGMSGSKTRHLYNNLCSLENANYLEIGTWKGSSFISANYQNNVNSVAVDNWSEFKGPKEVFLNNLKKHIQSEKHYFIEKDCFLIEDKDFPTGIKNFDIFLYDGAHDYESQKKAITHFHNFFSKNVIIIIDDWRDIWNQVIDGTWDGINETKMIVHKFFERKSVQPGVYWNGVGIFVCERIN